MHGSVHSDGATVRKTCTFRRNYLVIFTIKCFIDVDIFLEGDKLVPQGILRRGVESPAQHSSGENGTATRIQASLNGNKVSREGKIMGEGRAEGKT